MLLRALGGLARFGGRSALALGGAAAQPAAGIAYGAAAGALSGAAGTAALGYGFVRGRGAAFAPAARMGGRFGQLNWGIQGRLVGGALGIGALAGSLAYEPRYQTAVSNGNLEVKKPQMLEATGDLALSLNRNGRRQSNRVIAGEFAESALRRVI